MMSPCANSVLRRLKKVADIETIKIAAELCGLEILHSAILGEAEQWELLEQVITEGVK